MKVFGVLAIVTVVIAAALLSQSDAKNVSIGKRRLGDALIFRESVVKTSHLLRVVTDNVVFPPKGYVSNYNISAIYAVDHAHKNGGYGYLLSGGPGYRNATLHLKSERSHGLNFTVEIYGTKINKWLYCF